MTVGLLIGIAVGVSIGMLVAPEKGSETRRKLADSVGDWMEKIKNSFNASEEKNVSGSGSKSRQRTQTT